MAHSPSLKSSAVLIKLGFKPRLYHNRNYSLASNNLYLSLIFDFVLTFFNGKQCFPQKLKRSGFFWWLFIYTYLYTYYSFFCFFFFLNLGCVKNQTLVSGHRKIMSWALCFVGFFCVCVCVCCCYLFFRRIEVFLSVDWVMHTSVMEHMKIRQKQILLQLSSTPGLNTGQDKWEAKWTNKDQRRGKKISNR